MAKKKIKKHNKTFVFLYILFLAFLWCYFYFDRMVAVRTEVEMLTKPESDFSVNHFISNFCFLGWVITLLLLIVFTINNIMTMGLKALKTPGLVILITFLLFALAEICFLIAFKR